MVQLRDRVDRKALPLIPTNSLRGSTKLTRRWRVRFVASESVGELLLGAHLFWIWVSVVMVVLWWQLM